MSIDIKEPYSDGWWMDRLAKQLRTQAEHCDELQERYEGNPPLPRVHENAQEIVRLFLRKARTNWERLIVAAPLYRMRIVGIRTAVDSDTAGDGDAFGLRTSLNMKLVAREVHKMMFSMGIAYVIVGRDADGGLLVTAEDPRQVTAIVDPANPYRVLAGFKLVHDDVSDQDVAYLYMNGRVRVASRDRKARPGSNGKVGVTFAPSAYDWDDEDVLAEDGSTVRAARSGSLDIPGNPVTVFRNEDGKAEFEPQIPHLDRITDGLVHRGAIILAQAFKQRAIKGIATVDENGKPVDLDDLLRADPLSVWLLPAGAELWESGEANLQGVELAGRNDVKDLAAVSGTPLYSITPDAAGSAEGASLMREMTSFKSEAHIEHVDPAWELVAAQLLAGSGREAAADRTKLDVIWAPVERFSLSERANAVAQTKGVVPRRTQLTDIMGYSPSDADRMLDELTDDMVLDQQMAAARGGNAVAG